MKTARESNCSYNNVANSTRKISFRWIVAMIIAVLSSEAYAWNTEESPFGNHTQRRYYNAKAHNFIVMRAMDMLQELGALPFDPEAKAENMRTLDYLIAYGVRFADHVYMGPPENPNAQVPTFVDHLANQSYYDNAWDTDGPASKQLVEVSWVRNEKRFNTVLTAYWYWYQAAVSKGSREYNADNLYHYLNENAVELDYLEGDGDIFEGDPIIEDSAIGAVRYGATLFNLAMRFRPDSPHTSPQLSDLRRYSAGSTGTVVINDIGSNKHLRAKLPTFYLGGNPFICSGSNSQDPCLYGDPTWPVFVGGFMPGIDGSTTQSWLAALEEPQPQKKAKAAYPYLGWALHMLGDLSMPDHAKDRTGHGHNNVEKAADAFISDQTVNVYSIRPFLDQQRNEIVNSLKKEYSEMCRDFGVDIESGIDATKLFEETAGMSGPFYRNIHVDTDSSNKEKWWADPEVVNEVLAIGVAQTAKLIACWDCRRLVKEIYVSESEDIATRGCRIDTLGNVIVSSGGSLALSADDRIVIKAGFQAQAGSSFRASIAAPPSS